MARYSRRWNGQANVATDFRANALPNMSDRQLTFFANAFKASGDAYTHKLVLEEIERRCVLAYVEEGLGG